MMTWTWLQYSLFIHRGPIWFHIYPDRPLLSTVLAVILDNYEFNYLIPSNKNEFHPNSLHWLVLPPGDHQESLPIICFSSIILYNESLSYKLHLIRLPYLFGFSPYRHAKPDCGFTPQSNVPNTPNGCQFPQPISIVINALIWKMLQVNESW